MTSHVTDDPPEVERDGGLLRRFPSPTVLAVLGFVAVPQLVIPSVEWGENFFYFFLFGLWPMAKAVMPSVGEDDERPTDWIEMGPGSTRRFLVSMTYLQLNPFVQWRSVLQLAAPAPILLRYRFRLPNPRRYAQTTDFRLPFEGEWTVVSGGPTREESHSWGILTQRYAHDFVVTDADGRSYEGDGDDPAAFHCWDEPVLAPADGVVVETSDGHRDHHRIGWLDPRQRDIRGNWVTIEHEGGEYSVLAHLKAGSVRASEGDRVERGEEVGRCGHSGNSTEPHLHFHVQDRPSFAWGMGLPVYFADVTTRSPDGDVTGHDRAYLHAGQQVAPRERASTDSSAAGQSREVSNDGG